MWRNLSKSSKDIKILMSHVSIWINLSKMSKDVKIVMVHARKKKKTKTFS